MPTLIFDAILFDMDGTLIDSTPGVVKAWTRFAEDYGLGDAAHLVEVTHGVRLVDSLRKHCNIEDDEKMATEVMRFETEVVKGGPAQLPGVSNLLAQLAEGSSAAKPGWTIVTSATRFYAPQALAAAGIQMPPTIVTSEDVQRGKPFPDPYLEGAKRCGVDPANCLVVEDAVSGLKSGKAAGATTLAVCTSTTREAILASDANPDHIVQDLSLVSVRWIDGKIEISFNEGTLAN
jgi:HAD superfamily hydrolase (TIGR01509 family)